MLFWLSLHDFFSSILFCLDSERGQERPNALPLDGRGHRVFVSHRNNFGRLPHDGLSGCLLLRRVCGMSSLTKLTFQEITCKAIVRSYLKKNYYAILIFICIFALEICCYFIQNNTMQ